jgi:hypothetical protein
MQLVCLDRKVRRALEGRVDYRARRVQKVSKVRRVCKATAAHRVRLGRKVSLVLRVIRAIKGRVVYRVCRA